ncbi:hypothetical protein LINPERHAP1_LOCUS2215, partial [Linum perenne]
MEVLTGLPTRGRPVSVGYYARAADVICQELLGATPPPTRYTRHQVKILWVKEQFDGLPAGAPADVITCYARAFSWGSAVLAWLYKAMRRAAFFTGASQKGTGDIGGFTLLVQLWALERFPHIADRYIAGGDPPSDDSYPRDCIAWHHPDRCMRQFGFGQRVPQDAELAGRVEQLLGIDFRASVQDWGAMYAEYSRLWEQRGDHIATGEITPDAVSHHFHDEYDE